MNDEDRTVIGEDSRQIVFVDENLLKPLRAQRSLRDYIVSLWRSRFFVISYARAQSFNEGRGTFLGRIWLMLDPLLQIAVYALVFGVVLNTNRGIENFLGFLTLGVIYFKFLSQGMISGSRLIQKTSGLVASFGFPRVTLVATAVVKNIIGGIPAALIAIAISLAFQGLKNLHWVIFLVVPLYLIMNLFAAGLTLITARVTAFVPDISRLVSLISRALFFVSGVFFTLERFDGNQAVQAVMKANPFYVFLKMFRSLVLDGDCPPLEDWTYVLGWTLCVFVGGFLYFWRGEMRYHSVR